MVIDNAFSIPGPLILESNFIVTFCCYMLVHVFFVIFSFMRSWP